MVGEEEVVNGNTIAEDDGGNSNYQSDGAVEEGGGGRLGGTPAEEVRNGGGLPSAIAPPFPWWPHATHVHSRMPWASTHLALLATINMTVKNCVPTSLMHCMRIRTTAVKPNDVKKVHRPWCPRPFRG